MSANESTATRRPLVVIPQYFGSLVFDRRTSRYMPFDRESTALLCQLTRAPIGAVIAGAAPDQRAVIGEFCQYFYSRGCFTINDTLAADVLDLTPPADHLAGPLAVHLEVIAACNLTCTHCFAGVLPRNQAPLTLAEMDALFVELAGMGCYRLGLTGGEPLMRRDLFAIIDSATERGLHPCLTTNGLLITEHIAREFGKRDLVWLNVSLDGATAATNDAIRGAGTFERVRDRLKILARHARFTLAFTITSQCADEVEACALLARDVGAHTAVFRPLYPVGVARDHMALMPSFAQYTDALRRLTVAEVPTGGDLRGIDPFSPQARADTQAKIFVNNGCGAGNLVASISVRGDVNPCSFLGPAHDAGNIRARGFGDIWRREFSAIRRLPGACGDRDGFRGGCRARALAFGGDIDAVDPWHDEWRNAAHTGESAHIVHPMSNVEVDR